MTKKETSEDFLNKILKEALINIRDKYLAGAKKHNNTLLDLSLEQLILEALQENYDQYTYLKAIEKKLNEYNINRQRDTITK